MLRTRRFLLVAATLAMAVLALDTTAASAQPVAPPGTQSASAVTAGSYTVKPGDNLSGIARKTGVSLAALLAANNLTVTSAIHPGDTLALPGAHAVATPNTPAPTASATRYTVVSGDSLAGIAHKNGVTLKSLLAANGLTVTSAIHPGRVLQMPRATKPIPPSSSPTSTPTRSPTADASASPSVTLVSFLRAQVGAPYKFFSAGPDTFDCSGLVVAAYKKVGITLIHQSRMQATMGTAVNWRSEPLVAGDLVFTRSSNNPSQIGHVGIALDAATWIQAPGTGMSVRIGPLPGDDRIESVRRILQP